MGEFPRPRRRFRKWPVFPPPGFLFHPDKGEVDIPIFHQKALVFRTSRFRAVAADQATNYCQQIRVELPGTFRCSIRWCSVFRVMRGARPISRAKYRFSMPRKWRNCRFRHAGFVVDESRCIGTTYPGRRRKSGNTRIGGQSHPAGGGGVRMNNAIYHAGHMHHSIPWTGHSGTGWKSFRVLRPSTGRMLWGE